ncbi:MAG: AraC family transcriptional regulator [Lentisphaeria bacterium]
MSSIIKNLSKSDFRSSPQALFGEALYLPGGRCGPYVQDDLQFVVILRGEATLTVDGRPQPLPAEQTALLRIGGTHHFAFARHQETRHVWCTYKRALLPAAVVEQLRHAPLMQPLTNRVRTLFDLGLTLPRADSAEVHRAIESLAVALAHDYLLQASLAGGGTPLLPEAVRRARRLLDERFAESWTVPRLAAQVHVSPGHLARQFHQILGETPADYLWRTRLEHGLALLQGTTLSIGEIAGRTGFKSPFHFSRRVRAAHGVPPRLLRRRTGPGMTL